MKLKQIYLIILMTMVLLLAACTPLNSSPEARQNRLEAFLINRANGYDDVKAPNIYGLSDTDKKEIINGLKHDVVMGKESVLIDYLNEQWPAWRSADGFLLEHLNYLVMQSEKAVAKMPSRDISIKQAMQVETLQQFYMALDQLFIANDIKRDSLYVTHDGLFYYDWLYRDNALSLERVQMLLVDLPLAKVYSLIYQDGQLTLSTVVKSQSDLYGHLSWSETIDLVDEKALMPLIEQAEAASMTVTFRSRTQIVDNPIMALKTDGVFTVTDQVADGRLIGDLLLDDIVKGVENTTDSADVANEQNVENNGVQLIYKLYKPLPKME